MHGDGKIGRDQARAHQGTRQRQKTGRPAARIGHPGTGSDPVIAIRFEFGKTIGPVFGDAMRGGRVDHADIGIFDQRHRLARRIVRQTENDQIGGVEGARPRRLVLALGLGQGDHGQIAARGQPLADLQTRGSGCPIDEDFRRHLPARFRGIS